MVALLEMDDDMLAEVLSHANATSLARMRRVSKRCAAHVASALHLAVARRGPLPPAIDATDSELRRLRFVDLRDERVPHRLAAGKYHTVCVRGGDGALYSWGGSYAVGILAGTIPLATNVTLHHLGQGIESGPLVRVPAPMAGLNGVRVREVAAGEQHTLVLGACGGVWSCGAGRFGCLGHGDHTSHATPRRIDGLAQVRAVQVATGGWHSLVLSAAGHVYSFGYGFSSQLGHGDTEDNQPTPTRIEALRGTRIVQVSAGALRSMAVGEEGELYSWGYGSNGELGLGALLIDQRLPARVDVSPAAPGGGRRTVRIRQASCGFYHSLALDVDGALYSFGSGLHGRLGEARMAEGDHRQWEPTLVEALAGTPVRSAAAAARHSVALTEAGALLTFGYNGDGQLGHGDVEKRLVPTAVAALAGEQVAEVAAGSYHTVVRTAGGELWACGEGAAGQLGEGEGEGRPNEGMLLPGKVALPKVPRPRRTRARARGRRPPSLFSTKRPPPDL